MDLSCFDTVVACDRGAEVELVHPATKQPLGVFIKILGIDSSVTRQHIQNRANRAIKRAEAGKGFSQSAEAREDDEVEFLTVCTLGWRDGEKNTIEFRGKELPFTVANALELYRSQVWIRRQIDAATGDLKLFLPPLPPSEKNGQE